MIKRISALLIVSFFLGYLISSLSFVPQEVPVSINAVDDIPSPYARIGQGNIHLYSNKVVIDVEDPQWATFADTNSMDPVIDEKHFAIEVIPESEFDIHIGDIISYSTFQGTIIHRVIETGYDDQGWYAVTKGDNLKNPDPVKVRFDSIKRVVVAVIY